jgi:hypothetical protein
MNELFDFYAALPKGFRVSRFTSDRLILSFEGWTVDTVLNFIKREPFSNMLGLKIEDTQEFSIPASKEAMAALYRFSHTEDYKYSPIVAINEERVPYLYGNDRPLVGWPLGTPSLLDKEGKHPPFWQLGIGDWSGEAYIYVDPDLYFPHLLANRPGEYPATRPQKIMWAGLDMMPVFERWESFIFKSPARLLAQSFNGWSEHHYAHPLDSFAEIPEYAEQVHEVMLKKSALADKVRDRVAKDAIAVAGAMLALRATILGPINGQKYLQSFNVQIQGCSFAIAGQKIAQHYGQDWSADQIFDNGIIALA